MELLLDERALLPYYGVKKSVGLCVCVCVICRDQTRGCGLIALKFNTHICIPYTKSCRSSFWAKSLKKFQNSRHKNLFNNYMFGMVND